MKALPKIKVEFIDVSELTQRELNAYVAWLMFKMNQAI
jgi:hypothetical protein